MYKSIIHINQHNIKSNRKNKTNLPVISVKNYKSNRYTQNCKILDNEGNICAEIIYRPEKPLSCGATVWIETRNEVKI